MTLVERQQSHFRDMQNCAHRRAEVILNSHQCNTTENLLSLVLPNQECFFYML
jgi:hypothetical protein